MRLTIRAIGKLNAKDPLFSVLEEYHNRAHRLGGTIGLGDFRVHEFDSGRITQDKRQNSEAEFLLRNVSGIVVALDERGKDFSSKKLAQYIAKERDNGTRDMTFLIGGADGHHETVRERADMMIAVGAMTWPHMLVRVMLAEQLYRTTTILTGHPYHRE